MSDEPSGLGDESRSPEPGPSAAPTVPVGQGDSPDGLAELRALLVGEEQQRIEEIKTRIDDPSIQARELSKVLPRAVCLSTKENDELARALKPTVQDSLFDAARTEPGRLVDALFPVLGPALRRSINAALQGLVASIDQMLEQSFSVRAWQWRWEAFRTGKPFAEVLLSKTLVYRVEQVFLIHQRKGLLLEHVFNSKVVKRDEDMVSGMLNAVQQFLKDSFEVADNEELRSMQMGDLTVWTETGPEATLATVIRGHAPPEYRTAIQKALERIHEEFAVELRNFDGDVEKLAGTRLVLEECLWEQRQKAEADRKRNPWFGYAAVALVVMLVALFGWNRWEEAARWERYFDALDAEEGIVLAGRKKIDVGYLLSGLRDPGARDPQELLKAAGLEGSVVKTAFEPFESQAPGMLLRRARQFLGLPPERDAELRGRVLIIEGNAEAAWLAGLRSRLKDLAGIDRIDVSGEVLEPVLEPPAPVEPPPVAEPKPAGPSEELVRRVEALKLKVVRFKFGLQLAPEHIGRWQELAGLIEEIGSLAAAEKQRVTIRLVGHTDRQGDTEIKAPLGRRRAELVRGNLVAAGAADGLLAIAESVPAAPADDSSGADKDRRKVTFEVEVGGEPE